MCSKVANLTRRSWKGQKNAVRYLKGIQRVMWVMQAWENVDVVRGDVHVDPGWAKCPERKSTSGGMMMLKHLSRTVATRALSTAESRTLRSHHGSRWSSQDSIDVSGLGLDRATSSLDRQGGGWENTTRGAEVLVVSEHEQDGKSVNEKSSGRVELGRHVVRN